MNIQDALKYANSGKAVLFTGAGFSFGAKNKNNVQVPLGNALIEIIKSKLGTDEELSLEEAAEKLFSTIGPEKYSDFLAEQFSISSIEEYHENYAKIPWARIYTTNFDDLIEKAFENQGKDIKSLVLKDDTREIADTENIIVHLNGYIGKISASTIREDITLSELSYVANDIEASPWATQFRNDIDIAKAVFFIGYSLFDIDVKRMLFSNSSLKSKSFFILETSPEKKVLRRIKNYGLPVLIGVDGFGEIIKSAKEQFVPASIWENTGHCFTNIVNLKRNIGINTEDAFSLLFFGNYSRELIHSTIDKENQYYISRKYIQNIIAELKSGKLVCLHSYLGNGKTLLLEGLCYYLINEGYVVYKSEQVDRTALAECAEIIKNNKKVVFVFDDYPDWMRVIEYLSKNSSAETKFIFSSRSTAHEMYIESLADYFLDKQIIEFNINNLNIIEVKNINEMLKNNGLWGEYSGKSEESRLGILTDDCRSEFHGILLKILESQTIKDRLQSIIQVVNKRENASKLLISVILFNYLNERCTGSLLFDIFGSKVNDVGIRTNAGIREIFDEGQTEITLKSSVASYFILQNIMDRIVVFETLKDIAYGCDSRRHIELFRNIFKKIMRVAFLVEVIGRQRMDLILEYYNYCKMLRFCNDNPQFWLQYAMASMEIKNFEQAEIYFKTAYSYAERIRGYDLYQIDNHYARYLLNISLEQVEFSVSFSFVHQSMEIILRQISRERKKHPYSVALLIYNYWENNKIKFSSDQHGEIEMFSRKVLTTITRLPDYLIKDPIIREVKDKMQIIIKKPHD